MYSSTLSLTSALGGGGWSTPGLGRLAPVPLALEAGWAPGPVWTGAENLAPLSGFGPRTVQPVASCYTD
jgi:hypothetical protein